MFNRQVLVFLQILDLFDQETTRKPNLENHCLNDRTEWRFTPLFWEETVHESVVSKPVLGGTSCISLSGRNFSRGSGALKRSYHFGSVVSVMGAKCYPSLLDLG